MKKIIITSLISIASILGLSSQALAIGEGFSIGISGSNTGFYGVGKETTDVVSNTGTRSTEESGAFGTEIVTVLAEFNAGPIIFGIDYSISDIETPENVNRQSSGDICDDDGNCGSGTTGVTNKASASFENHTTIYAIVPVIWGAYIKAGMIHTDVVTTENLGTGASYPDVDTEGYTVGLGYQHEMDNGLAIRLEATAAQYDDVSVSSSTPDSTETTAKKIDMRDMMSARGTISIVKTF